MREMCQGKVCVVVNVASFCGLTVTEYNQMNDLVEKFPCDKFLILAFPCNQFCFEASALSNFKYSFSNFTLNHENAFGEEEILNMLKHVRPGKGFVPKATMFERIDVNGKDALPMFEFLKREIPCPVDDPLYLLKHETFHYWDPLFRYDISGNFEKFLIDQNGRVVKRYSPMYQMKYLEDDICQLLNIKQDNNLEAQETNRRDDDPDIHPSNKGLKRTWDPSEEDTPKDQAKKEKLDDFFDGSGKHECIVQHKCGEECKAMVDNSQCKPYHKPGNVPPAKHNFLVAWVEPRPIRQTQVMEEEQSYISNHSLCWSGLEQFITRSTHINRLANVHPILPTPEIQHKTTSGFNNFSNFKFGLRYDGKHLRHIIRNNSVKLRAKEKKSQA
ncbi:unnamed protein product, partial [Notodromas monacha]